jgi:hypothetical protein
MMAALVAGCEEFGQELSPERLAAIQAQTRRLSDIDQDLAQKGLSARAAGVPEVRVPISFHSSQPMVRLTLANGASRKVMFDTGATLSVLGAKEALKHGAMWVDARDVPEITGRGVLGEEPFSPAVLPDVRVGDWKVGSIPILVPAERARLAPGLSIALLGFQVVRKHCSFVTIDYPNKELVFGFGGSYQPSGSANARRSPLRISGGVPMTRLSSGGVSWEAVVDTGSFNGVEISASVARSMGRERDGIGVPNMTLGGVGGMKTGAEVGLRYIFLPELRACGMVHRNAQVDISPGIPRIGSFFLQDYKVTIDLKNRTLWLEW